MEKAIVFGMGKFFRENEQQLMEKYEILCYLDNRIQGNNVEYHNDNVPVYNPNKILQCKNVHIILMVKKFVDLFYQLMLLNIEEERIIFGSFLFSVTEKENILLERGKLKTKDRKLVYEFKNGEEDIIENQLYFDELVKQLLKEKYYKENQIIQMLPDMPLRPVSRDFGLGRGRAIDRYYIEAFLGEFKNDIKGNVLEIADNTYTIKYGENRVENSYVLHVEGWGNTIKGNLETGEGLKNRQFDTLIITQTLMFIYDLKSAASNIYKIMKDNATALITVAGISQISRYDASNWGSYWGFHEDALKRLFVPVFGEGNVQIRSYGNVKTATAMLYGMCCEELKEDDFKIQDIDYPVIVAAYLRKRI